jgi:SAM-dependent methyltransferase
MSDGKSTIAELDNPVEERAPRSRADAALAPAGPGIPYGAGFFEALAEGTRRSAAIVTPMLVELFRPESVVDVGCGTGLWLAAFRQHGVADVCGVDGPWVPRAELQIPATLFHQHDLSRPLELGRRFDLALCLEVAEHLPPEAADQLVEGLTRLAPIVVFSAAIPFQQGDGHINEQWPSFWCNLFAAYGYDCLSDLRHRVWSNPSIEVWYRQNLLCFVAAESRRRLPWAGERASDEPVDVVHPDLYVRAGRDLAWRRREAAELEQRNRQLRQELQNVRQELESIRSSRAWRMWERMRPAVNSVWRAGARLRPH